MSPKAEARLAASEAFTIDTLHQTAKSRRHETRFRSSVLWIFLFQPEGDSMTLLIHHVYEIYSITGSTGSFGGFLPLTKPFLSA